MKKISVFVVDGSEQLCKTLCDYFTNSEKVEVIGTANDGITGAAKIQSLNPDIVLLDIVLPGIDGYGVLECLSMMDKRPKTIITSALSQDTFINKALKLGAEYYLVKPFDLNSLQNRIIEFFKKEEKIVPLKPENFSDYKVIETEKRYARQKSLEERITNIFMIVGIPAHIKGYQFLREAIKLAVDTPEIINSITKKLYPAIAERYDTSSSKVERAIRHAIEVAWNRGKIENINNLFGVRVYSSNDKPTNGEFIALVADKMLIEGVS